MRFAAQRGFRVAPQGTGHGAAPLDSLEETILLKTTRMRDVSVDPRRQVARASAGVLWREVVAEAAPHGLVALAGSSPDVGVIGYTLGGGLSWLARKYGLAANNVETIELVLPDGQVLRVEPESEHEDLFWALRGGGSLGVVTAIEMRLFRIQRVQAGILWWPIDRARDALDAWRALTQDDLPEELSTVGRLLQLPDIPDVPEPLRGGAFVAIEVIHLGRQGETEELLAPLRALEPMNDTDDTVAPAALSSLHMDPEYPTPMVGDGQLLATLTTEAIEAIASVTGAGSGSPLMSVELRHLGGEVAHARPGNGALAAIDAQYLMFAVGVPAGAGGAREIGSHIHDLQRSLAPWAAEQMYLSFAETPRDPRTFWSEESYRRLAHIKAEIDPTNLIQSAHPIAASGVKS